MQVTINLDDKISFTSREVGFTLDLTKVPADRLAELVATAARAGFTKAAIDAGSGAKAYSDENKISLEDATRALIGKRITTFESGEWGRMGGEGMDPVEAEMIAMIRPIVKAGDAKAYKAADADGRTEMCVAAIAALKGAKLESLRKQAEVNVSRKQAEARAAKEATEQLAKELGIAI